MASEINNPSDIMEAVSMSMIRRTATAVHAAGEVAKGMRERIRNAGAIDESRLGDYVTEADLAVAESLRESLLAIIPDAGILTEDGTCSISSSGRQWIIDPIDGTSNYLSGFPYAVSVAYEEDGQVGLGMVYEPETGRLFWARRGEEPFLVRDLPSIMPCYIDHMAGGGWLGKPIKRTVEANIAIIGMPYSRSRTDDMLQLAREFHQVFGDVKRVGPASLDICRIAIGDAMLYAEYDLKPWDYAAAKLIAMQSGCVFEERDDGLVMYSTPAGMRRRNGEEDEPSA